MQVLKRRNNKRITLSLFQSSWHILSIQNGNASGCCGVFLPWTFILVFKNNELLLLKYFSLNINSALRKVVSTFLYSGIVSRVWPLSCLSQSEDGLGLIYSHP